MPVVSVGLERLVTDVVVALREGLYVIPLFLCTRRHKETP
jgi:hypothetical protein